MLRSVFLLCAVLGVTLLAQTGIPATPAGRALGAWLEAYSTGDRTRIAAFVQKFEPSASVDKIMDFRKVNGPLEFIAIEKADSYHITFQARQPGNDHPVTGELAVAGNSPAQIQSLNFLGLHP